MNERDLVRRFNLERHPIRGHAVRMSGAWQNLREHQDYPPAVQKLLGEAIGAVVLLAATLKFNGTITLQLQGRGVVNLLVAQCTHDFKVRGMARHDPIDGELGFLSLTGEGTIVVTVEATDRASSYQGVVPISGDSLAKCLEAYFMQSEQLPTRVALAATADAVSGMLVQRIPGEGGKAIDLAALESAWMKADHAMAALSPADLIEDDVEERLVRMFGDDEVRVFGGSEVKFECRCSRDRVANVLRSLGVEEVRAVIAEQGAVTVTCEFCRKPYKFDSIDAEHLFAQVPPQGNKTIN
jgi:molecular chaperone Hsp33